MKTVTKNNKMIRALEMAEIFKVEVVDGVKRVSRWGFFANQNDGTYAVYKPERPICDVDELYGIEEDGPGAIDIVDSEEINAFLHEIERNLRGLPTAEVSMFTPCGWYYDTII